MSRILFATDFSPVAQNAATYAAQLAVQLGCEFTLFHAYVVPFSYTDTILPLLNANEILTIATDNMAVEKRRLETIFKQLFIRTKLVPGELINSLKDEIEEEKPLLLTMGTSGGDEDSILWGSLAVRALRAFKIPVLTIPVKARWTPINKIAFVADFQKISERTPFHQILGWTKMLSAGLSVVHIEGPNEKSIPKPEILTRELATTDSTYHTISTESIPEKVPEFIRDHGINWFVLIPRKFGFWKSLFFKSKTNMLRQISGIPVLSIHED